MNEVELEEAVRARCKQLGLYRYHAHDSRRSERGWPDDVILGIRGALFRELKTEHEHPSPGQTRVLWLLKANGFDAGVWRPSDLGSGRINEEMEAIA